MFEERILTDPALQQDIELTQAMREGLRELKRRGEIAELLAVRRPPWFGSTFAFAASIAAVTFATISLLLYSRLDQIGADSPDLWRTGTPTAQETLYFVLTRSAEQAPYVSWHRAKLPTLLILTFDVGLEPAETYGVVIGRESDGALIPLLALPIAATDADGRVQLSIHSGLLQPGDYEIRLTPRAGSRSGDSWDYSMRVLD